MIAAAYSPVITPGDPGRNVECVAAAMERAAAAGAEVLLLPELCLTGATCGDLFWQKLLLEETERALEALAERTRAFPGLTLVLGAPLRWEDRLYSCAVWLRDGAVLAASPLESGDMRWFAPPPREGGTVAIGALPPAAFAANAIVSCGELRFSLNYGSDVLLLPGLYAADVGSVERLGDMLRGASAQGISCMLACPGAGESTTDNVYTGFAAIAVNGRLLDAAEGAMVFARLSAASWERSEGPRKREVLHPRTPLFPYDEQDSLRRCARILSLQVRALRSRMERIGAQRLVLGVSGGLDSTLALLVSAGALDALSLPRGNLLAVTMPGFGTTGRTRSNAEVIARELGCDFREIPIGESVGQHFRDIGHDPEVRNAAFENAQARERTQVLMDLANDLGGIVVGTGDMSELALGWCTYNGDHMSMYAVNTGVPKTAVRRVVDYFARSCPPGALQTALRDVLDTPVSPELLPGKEGEITQVTEDLIGPYELHDFFLCRFLALGERPKELLRAAAETFAPDYDAETVKKWLRVFLRRFFTQQFKRSCSPDGAAVMGLSLSPRCGWRMSSDISPEPWLRELDD